MMKEWSQQFRDDLNIEERVEIHRYQIVRD